MTRLALWGDEHLEYGRVAVAGVDGLVGLAITAGWGRPSWSHDDHSEDALGVDVGSDRWRLVLCDGHNGFSTAKAALKVALAAGGDPLDAVVAAADEAALAAKVAAGEPLSATAFVVAAIMDGVLDWRSVGDSGIFLVRGGRATRLDDPDPWRFVGYSKPNRVPAVEAMQRGRVGVAAGDAVVVASDGFTDHPAVGELAHVLGTVPDPVGAAVALVRRTEAIEPFDNVAVGVLRIP